MKKNVAYGLLASAIMLPNLSWAETQEAKEPEKLEIPKPTIYGKINLTQERASLGNGESFSRLSSNSSRLGIKGKFQLNSQLTAIYQAEFGLDADTNKDKDDNAISRRNTYIGLESQYGKLMAGYFDTPLKLIQNKIDLFNDIQGDIGKVITNSEKRSSDTVQYSSPKLSGILAGLNANFAFVNADKDDEDNGYSTSLTWANKSFYIAAAYDNKIIDSDTETIRLASQYKIGPVQLGALWEQEKDKVNDDSESGWLASAKYQVGKAVAVKAQYGQSDIKKEDGRTLSLGMDYSFNDKARTFAYVTEEKFAGEDTSRYVGVGLEYSF